MGQQQLLLTILVTILIGIAIVVAIDTMQAARENASETAIRQDMMMVLNDARIYYQKPGMLGGGGNSFDGISQDQILSIDPTNENGSYTVSGSGKTVTIEGTGANGNVALSLEATMTSDGMDLSWSNL